MKPLKILFATSELAPLTTTGGLGDVAFALPNALRTEGHDVRIVMPLHKTVPASVRGEQYCMVEADLGTKKAYGAMRLSTVPGTDIPLYFIEHNGYFDRDLPYGYGAYEYEDNAERFCFFSLALLHGIAQTGWRPDVVHCNDWHTAAIPLFIKTRLAHTMAWRGMPTLFTIHNLAFQGRYSARVLPNTGLSRDLFTADCLEFHGDINLMKAAIAFSSRINTVSPQYAKEIQTPQYGNGLDGFLRTRSACLSGILNGVDYGQWHPTVDRYLPVNYSVADLTGKQTCKESLQRRLELAERDVPLFGMVSRLFWQKGVDLLIGALHSMMTLDIQIVVLGTGDPYYEQALQETAKRYGDKLRVLLGFDVAMSHLIEAGVDFFLMPSHFEPCGLSQLYSLAYGTIPLVRETGGLADSVTPINTITIRKGTATGLLFQQASSEAFAGVVRQAFQLFHDRSLMRSIRMNGMRQDFSWKRSCQEYVQLYQKAISRP